MSKNDVIRQVDVEEIIRDYYSERFPALNQEHEELQGRYQQLQEELRAKQAEYDSEHNLRIGAEQRLEELQDRYEQLGREKERLAAEKSRLVNENRELARQNEKAHQYLLKEVKRRRGEA